VAALDKEVSQQDERLRLIKLMVIELGNQGVVSEYSQNLNLVISRCLDQEHQKSVQKFLTNNIFEKAQSHLDKGLSQIVSEEQNEQSPKEESQSGRSSPSSVISATARSRISDDNEEQKDNEQTH
jgi:hypothetical protein